MGLLCLCAIGAIQPLRVFAATNHYLLSAAILSLAMLVIVPARIWPFALLLAAAVLWLMRCAMKFKERVVGLPITYLDVVTNVREPHIVARAVGFHSSMATAVAVMAILMLLALTAALRAFGRPSGWRLMGGIAESAALTVVAALILSAAERDVRDSLTTIFPHIALSLWNSEGQRELERRMGPLEYLAYTYVSGDADVTTTDAPAPPLPRRAIELATKKYIQPGAPEPASLPNIVIFHAESTFDPNFIFRLTRSVNLPLWGPTPDTRSLGPLSVNIIGGGSQVTEFEVLTGVDSRGFGYQGFYTHQTIGPRVRRALPAYLAAKGYETFAYYTETADFFGVGAAFQQYGFHHFFDQQALGLRNDWTNTDRDVVAKVIARGGFAPSERPRLLFISTLENHGPHPCLHFKSRADFVTSLSGGASFSQDCSINEFVRRARSTSAAVDTVLLELRRLETVTHRPYVLLVYGDHQPWSFTDGTYSVADGSQNDRKMGSFARFRRGNNQKITFYHIFSSASGRVPRSFGTAIPATLLPSLVSAYVASDADDVYLRLNLLAFARCGTDFRVANCPLRDPMGVWLKDHLFGRSLR